MQEWKRTRLLAFFMLQPYSKELKEPKDLFLLDEERIEQPQMSPEQVREWLKKVDAKVLGNAGKNSGS